MTKKTTTYEAWASTVAPFESQPVAPMVGFNKVRLVTCLAIVVLATDILDHMKKSCFYGRAAPEEHVTQRLFRDIQILANSAASPTHEASQSNPMPNEAQGMRLFHGLLGRITETGELASALVDALNGGGTIDATNVVEELGDGMVYDLYTLQALGVDFETMLAANAAKLCKRFGTTGSFSTGDANTRDLLAERSTLEAMTDSQAQ